MNCRCQLAELSFDPGVSLVPFSGEGAPICTSRGKRSMRALGSVTGDAQSGIQAFKAVNNGNEGAESCTKKSLMLRKPGWKRPALKYHEKKVLQEQPNEAQSK